MPQTLRAESLRFQVTALKRVNKKAHCASKTVYGDGTYDEIAPRKIMRKGRYRKPRFNSLFRRIFSVATGAAFGLQNVRYQEDRLEFSNQHIHICNTFGDERRKYDHPGKAVY
ncbi:hypothetical protein AVEN_144094-1 [Araneus ventricosus]|uniref:Uncharacterized protein n=1 Tax=Araneus ventricosus TaxID=182803 RepID=A0A4Y2QYN8_ARAVE|nr:hypothetical protein AVEN_144094-1 [Araneus ventricosus]